MKKRKMIMRVVALFLAGILVLSLFAGLLTGCSNQPASSVEENTPPVQEVVQGDIFLRSGFKMKAVLTPQTVTTLDPLTFEVYVDSNGNGNGLLGYRDDVYNVIISNDKVYIVVGSETVVNLTTVTGHMIPASLTIAGKQDLKSDGFTLFDDSVVAYKANTENILYDVTYSKTDSIFDATTVAAGNSMELNDFVSYILDYQASLNVSTEGTPDVIIKESFYNKADEGVKIHDAVYSIGDYCNPSTYFESVQPSGLVPEYAYNKDDKIEFLHISYISSDGLTEFVTTDGYVQSIKTTSEFEFLETKRGDLYDDVSRKFGIGLKKDELPNYKPVREGLAAVKGKSSQIIISYKDLSITLEFDKSKALSAITVTNYIDFMEEG